MRFGWFAMPSKPKLVYWDASAFLSYFNAIQNRLAALNALLADASSGKIHIVTSVVSIAEVVYSADKQGVKHLSDEAFARIDTLMHNRGIVTLIEVSPVIARRARNLQREGLSSGRFLSPMDSIHLATASLMEPAPAEIHTYDEEWAPWTTHLDIPIVKPQTDSPRLMP